MPYDGSKIGLRELSKSSSHTLPVASPNGKQQDNSSSPRAQRNSNSTGSRFALSQLVSRQYGIFWLVWLLLLGVFLIRHTTKLLDAAGQQHYLLAPPTAAATASATRASSIQQQPAQTHDSTHAATSKGANTFVSSSSSSSSSSSAGAEALLAAQRSKWPDGYLAVCAVMKDQWPDLRYWIEYHRWLGVSKFYIYDNNSTLPAMLMLWDYMREGIVEYDYFLGRPRRRPDFTDTNQYRAYQGCLLQHFKQHRWLAFIDADEFFVLQPQGSSAGNNNSSTSTDSSHTDQLPGLQGNNAQQQHVGQDQRQQHVGPRFGFHDDLVIDPSQPAGQPQGGGAPTPAAGGSRSSNGAAPQPHNLALFLSDFEGQAALGVNWVLFGSSGHLTRPAEGPLGAYTACVPRRHWESTHVKVIANTAGVMGVGGTPHEVLPRAGKSIVDVDKVPFKGPKTPQAKWHKLVLHHYVLKSKAEFVAKQARGSGAGNKKDWGYWEYIEKLANETCSEGVPVSAAFLASQPRLRLPASAHVLQGCHSKAVAAYEALLLGAKDDAAAVQQEEDIEMLPC